MVAIKKYLTNVAALVEQKGYAKAGTELPTWKEALELPEPESINPFVAEAIEWAISIKPKNLYEKKLKAYCSKENLNESDLPIVASLITAYQRNIKYHEKLRETKGDKELETNTSDYVGGIGMKLDINVVDMKTTKFEGYYGPTTLYQFLDDKGNVYVWKTQTDFIFSPKIHAEVKDYKLYNGVKQTVLTRVERIR